MRRGNQGGPFRQRPHAVVQDVVAESLSQEAEPEVLEAIKPTEVSEFSSLSPIQYQEQAGTVARNSALEAVVPEMNLNLLHPAVRDLNLIPVERELPIGGRLRFFLPNWQKLTQDSFILQVVQGLQIPFITTPVQTSLPFQSTTGKNAMLIDSEVQDMLAKGAIKQVQPCAGQFLSPVFLVPRRMGATDQ